ncbi:MarR family transcriptional regulator, partial [Nocardia sp. NPDC058497]|uniref:MarR family transcriptional regulator n=1 Tax=Nocardia sp. NPDC058497 TaxID=3346529 RepID=UPI003647A88D
MPSASCRRTTPTAREAAEPTVSTVAAALAVDQPRASKLVAAAVTAGYLRRVADQSDGRR